MYFWLLFIVIYPYFWTQGIIGDLFPGLPLPQPGLPHLVECLKEVCVKINLQANDFFIEKVNLGKFTLR